MTPIRRVWLNTSINRSRLSNAHGGVHLPPCRRAYRADDNSSNDRAPLPAGRSWPTRQRLSKTTDQLLARLAIASQKVNTYTGTDYSAVETIREDIKSQEQIVKSGRSAIQLARVALGEAHARQAASQKEVVGLLERKSSWAATDLERYMTLIRSEHNHEKAVQSASDQLGAAERELEDARSSLERLERLQYHEEQIWSDNIRRNSTWVTIGLMGANIFILLVTVVIIEPWRRKRLVIEIKRELERRIAADGKPHASAASLLPVAEDSLAGRDRSDTELSTELSEARPGLENGSTTVDPALQGLDEDKVHEDKVHESSQMSRDMLLQTDGAATLATVLSEDTPLWRNALNCFNAVVADPLGQREVSLTNLGVTSTAITGVAVGAITTSLALVLLRGR